MEESDRSITIDQVIEFMEQKVPFNRHLGIRVAEIREGFARLELPFSEEFVGDPMRPALHGGVVSTLIDTCGGAAVWSVTNSGDRLSTVDLRVDFMWPAPLEALVCESTVLRMGNRVGVASSEIFSLEKPDRIIAVGKGVYNVKRRAE